MSRKSENEIRKTIIKKAIETLTAPVYTRALDREACVNECFMVAINDPEMREYMNTRTDRQVARMGSEVKKSVDRHFNRRIVREVYVAHNTIISTSHKIYVERVPRGGGSKITRWYGVNRNVSQSSIKRLNWVLLMMQIRGGWTAKCGIYKEGMYFQVWR